MSGGSYNYMFLKDTGDLLRAESDLRAMADRLAGIEFAADAAKETQEILNIMDKISVMKERLSVVWQAVEWIDSGDSGEASLKRALEKYREG